MENKDYRVVLVIGNGFDLDLGLKTKYNDYMNSDYLIEHILLVFMFTLTKKELIYLTI